MVEYGESRDEVFLARDIAKAKNYSEETAKKIDAEIKSIIDRAYADAKRILTDRGTDWPWLHQFPGGRKSHELVGMTVDSLFAVCEDRELWTCRGGRTPGPWQRVRV